MDAVETVDLAGHTFRITIYPDSDAPNPLEYASEIGTIVSLMRKHDKFDARGADEALAGYADRVPLSYYKHALCLWSVASELPAISRCRFDSVPLAGVWLPDAETLVSAAPLLGLNEPPTFHAHTGTPSMSSPAGACTAWRNVRLKPGLSFQHNPNVQRDIWILREGFAMP